MRWSRLPLCVPASSLVDCKCFEASVVDGGRTTVEWLTDLGRGAGVHGRAVTRGNEEGGDLQAVPGMRSNLQED